MLAYIACVATGIWCRHHRAWVLLQGVNGREVAIQIEPVANKRSPVPRLTKRRPPRLVYFIIHFGGVVGGFFRPFLRASNCILCIAIFWGQRNWYVPAPRKHSETTRRPTLTITGPSPVRQINLFGKFSTSLPIRARCRVRQYLVDTRRLHDLLHQFSSVTDMDGTIAVHFDCISTISKRD